MSPATPFIDQMHNPAWPHADVATEDPNEAPELATTATWRTRMREARSKAGLTQAQLAAKVGVTQNMISLIESGNVASSKFVLPICEVLKITPPRLRVEDESDQRWLEAGRTLRLLNRPLFDQQLRLVEMLAAAAEGREPPEH
jgi:transcriptional regulator with XRE-family HTH domain